MAVGNDLNFKNTIFFYSTNTWTVLKFIQLNDYKFELFLCFNFLLYEKVFQLGRFLVQI